jgi:hypothetical protein
MQHTSEKTDETLGTDVYNMYTTIATYAISRSIFSTSIQYICNTPLKHLKHVCNMRFHRNIFLLLGRMEDYRRVEFTGVELASSAEIAAPAEKATAVTPVEGGRGPEKTC